MGWMLRLHGTAYEIVPGDDVREAVLLADGLEVDRRTTGFWGRTRLGDERATFEVQWGPRNTIASAHRLATAEAEGTSATHKIPLVPPPGSRAARREALARDRPRLFVLRQTAQAVAQILLGTLGIGALLAALFGALLPRIDLSWIPTPDLPDVHPPDWLVYLDPFAWLAGLGLSWPNLPGWLDAVLAQQKYWLPVVIAFVVALHEIAKRRTKDAEREADAREAGRREDDPEA